MRAVAQASLSTAITHASTHLAPLAESLLFVALLRRLAASLPGLVSARRAGTGRRTLLLAVAAAWLVGSASAVQAANTNAIQAASLNTVQTAGTPAVYDIHGHLPDLKFTLSSAHGRTVSQDDFKNKTILLFFGYASCPDVCPTTMAQLADVMNRLGDSAADVRIVFISVDPHRDTPDRLQAYVSAFNNNAVGLTGSERQIADIAKRYRVSYQIDKPKPGADLAVYNVTHSRGVYVFDGLGEARLLLSDSSSTEQIVDALRKLVSETRR